MVQMEETEHYDMLEDDTLAPLKRNHACLQCKKRKVKCDAVCLSLSHDHEIKLIVDQTNVLTVSSFSRSRGEGSH
jgi:hypothetical protein